MTCRKCNSELPANAGFCSACGYPAAPPTSAPPERSGRITTSAVRPSSSRNLVRALLAALAIVLAVIALIAFLRMRRAPVTERIARPPAPAPVTERTAEVPPGPPQEVIDYLAFLKEIERQRLSLQKKQIGQLTAMIATLSAGNIAAYTTDNPEQEFSKTTAQLQQKTSAMEMDWQDLCQRFRAKQPPRQCQRLADVYFEALRQVAAACTSIPTKMLKAMSGSQADKEKAIEDFSQQSGKGGSTPSDALDDAIKAADDELAAVCTKYSIRKDFDIVPDAPGGGLLGR